MTRSLGSSRVYLPSTSPPLGLNFKVLSISDPNFPRFLLPLQYIPFSAPTPVGSRLPSTLLSFKVFPILSYAWGKQVFHHNPFDLPLTARTGNIFDLQCFFSISMTKRHADAQPTLSLRENEQPWHARGYRPELANSKRSPNEDPKGEIAYQRAFADAAKQNPPRVPNPDFYPNSPSARNYIMRRAEALFSVRKTSSLPNTPASSSSPQSQYERHDSPRHEKRHASHKPNLNVKLEPTAYPHMNNGYHNSPTTARPLEEPRPFGNGPPMTLEPNPERYAPKGPPENPFSTSRRNQ